MINILEIVRTRIGVAHMKKEPIRMSDAELLAFADAAYAIARVGGDVGIVVVFTGLPEQARAQGIECALDRVPVVREELVLP